MKLRPVVIVWRDACHHAPGEWLDGAPDDLQVMVTTVGFLIRKGKRHLVVAQSVCDGGLLTGVFSIPRSNVVKISEVSRRKG
jgi:hypothetical protein